MSGPTALEVIVSWRCGEDESTEDDWIMAENLVVALEDAGYRIVPVDPLELHVVRFTSDGWTLRHPLFERISGDLFDCEWNDVLSSLFRPPEGVWGDYEATFVDGNPEFVKVEEDEKEAR